MTKIRVLPYIFILLLAYICTAGNLCHADSFTTDDYQILDLGYLSKKQEVVKAYAINDNSQIVGVSTTNGTNTAFIYNATTDSATGRYTGTMSAVDNTAINSTAYDINNAGQIVGTREISSKDNSRHSSNKHTVSSSYVSSNGTVSTIAINGTAYAINSNGEVVGSVDGQAYTWSSSEGITKLGTSLSTASDINDAGTIVGQTSNSDGYLLDTSTGNLTTVYSLFSDINVTAVNNNNDAVGTVTSFWGNTSSFYLSDGQITEITDGASNSEIEAISMNDKGVVVGSADGHAFVWDSVSGLYDLNNLLSANSGWSVLVEATDINNLGQIVGWGIFNGEVRSFLLTRVAAVEASTIFMIMLSGLVIFIKYRKSRLA